MIDKTVFFLIKKLLLCLIVYLKLKKKIFKLTK